MFLIALEDVNFDMLSKLIVGFVIKQLYILSDLMVVVSQVLLLF